MSETDQVETEQPTESEISVEADTSTKEEVVVEPDLPTQAEVDAIVAELDQIDTALEAFDS